MPAILLAGGTSGDQQERSTLILALKSLDTIRAVVPPETIFFPSNALIFSPRISSASFVKGGPVTMTVFLGRLMYTTTAVMSSFEQSPSRALAFCTIAAESSLDEMSGLFFIRSVTYFWTPELLHPRGRLFPSPDWATPSENMMRRSPISMLKAEYWTTSFLKAASR